MNGQRIALLVVVVFAVGIFGMLALPDSPETLELPADLKSSAAEIPEEQNNLIPLLAIFGKSTPEQAEKLRDAIFRLKTGKGVEDQTLLAELPRMHEQAVGMLKPPLSFSQNGQVVAIGLFRLFQGAEVLARQAMLENDYPRADRILGDLLRWSRLLRNGQPNQVQWAISRSGWKIAFDTLLQDLPGNPDESKRLDEIERMFRENRIEKAELIECLRMEARWRKEHGGLKAMLDEPDAYMLTVFLKPPFNDVSSADLRALPYDVKADFQRDMDEMQGMLDGLKGNVPISSWPGFDVPVTGRTLEDYRKRPNGLGDLFYEQRDFAIQGGFWASALSSDRLMDACLLWLKQERSGKKVTGELFKEILDPVDGEPLSIDIKLRMIRSRGPNMKIDPPDAEGAPMRSAGSHVCGDDVVMVIPRWNADSGVNRKPADP